RRRAAARRDDDLARRAGGPRGGVPADGHGPAARRGRRQRARGTRGARDGARRGPGRLLGARARRVRTAARALRPRRRRRRGAAAGGGGGRRRERRGDVAALARGAGRHGRRGRAARGSRAQRGDGAAAGLRARAVGDRHRSRRRPPGRRPPYEGRPRRPRGRDRVPREARRAGRGGGAAGRDPRALGRGGRAGGARRARGVRPRRGAAARAAAAARRRLVVPELPEVETVRRRLAPVLEGRTLARVEIGDARLTRPLDPVEMAAELDGERVALVDRRGKYLVVRFESGRALLVHLRMTGSFLLGGEDDPHRRAVLTLDDGTRLAYRDVRRFGTWLLLEPGGVDAYLDARVGREPLAAAYRSKHLAERLAGRRAPVKAALLDQRTVAGVGNIYADEALWRARVHPLTPALALGPVKVSAVYRGVRDALRAGIRRQGSTLRDY